MSQGDAGYGPKPIPFIAVGRVMDKETLASYSTMTKDQTVQTLGIFTRLLEAAKKKLQPGQSQRLKWNEGSVCCKLDRQGVMLYGVLTASMSYPEKHAHSILNKLMQEVEKNHPTAGEGPAQDLNPSLQPRMAALVAEYENPEKVILDSSSSDSLSSARSSNRDSSVRTQARMSGAARQYGGSRQSSGMNRKLALAALCLVLLLLWFVWGGSKSASLVAPSSVAAVQEQVHTVDSLRPKANEFQV
mmetsp:Transcript_1010/g.2232  ORF Transcript_1010/g.2232 Transcript_1010/m.2232 type:complete len:245 (+) Transcript_1010:132-866(+)